MTALGQLPFFIDFLKSSGLFEAFVADCPLRYVSPNAAKKRDVLGTAMLSMLSGHTRATPTSRRFAATRCCRSSGVPGDEDDRQRGRGAAVRRAFKAIDETEAAPSPRGRPSGRGGTGLQPQEAGAPRRRR